MKLANLPNVNAAMKRLEQIAELRKAYTKEQGVLYLVPPNQNVHASCWRFGGQRCSYNRTPSDDELANEVLQAGDSGVLKAIWQAMDEYEAKLRTFIAEQGVEL